ncbi:MAG: hypothetical protein ABSA53_07270 [Streptosporangiaceae bacterium]
MPADGHLRRVLADGALPFRYRGSVRTLLGEPEGPGLLRATPPAPQPQFSYPRSAWLGEVELPDDIRTVARDPLDWPAGNDRPRGHRDRGHRDRGHRDRGTATGGMSRGTPDEIPEPAAGHPPALPRPAVTAEAGPQPGAAARSSAVMEVSPAAVPGPAPVRPAGSAHAAQPQITEPAQHMAAELTQTPVVGPARPPGPHTGRRTAAGPGLAGPTTAPARRGPEPTASAGGSRELLIPGRTVRSSVMTGSEEAGAWPAPSGLTRPVSTRPPGGPLRRSAAEPTGITGREPAATESSGAHSLPDRDRTVARIPPPPLGATARKRDGGTVIPGGQATPLRVQRPAGPGRQTASGPAGQADTPPPRRPAPAAGHPSRVEQPPATPPAAIPVAAPAPAPAPQLVVMLPPRTPTAPAAFWERRRLGRLWSRPLR